MKRNVALIFALLLLIAWALLKKGEFNSALKVIDRGPRIERTSEVVSPEPAMTGSGNLNAASANFPPSQALAATASIAVPEFAPIPLGSGDVPAEMQIEAIVRRADVPDRLKARLLIQMLPGLPEEALAKAADEAASRLPDADYVAVMLPTVLDPRTHGLAMSVLFADLMERPDAITLPALVTIARNSEHPYAPSARDNLALLLGQDFGGDWSAWEKEIRARLTQPGGR